MAPPLVGPGMGAPVGPPALSLQQAVFAPLPVLDDLYVPPNPFNDGAPRAGLLLALGAPPALQFPTRASQLDDLYVPPNPFDDGAPRPAPLGPSMGLPALVAPGLQFLTPVAAQAAYTLRGVTRDGTGAVLGGCTVDLFYSTGDKQRCAQTTSDPTTGAYAFQSGDNVSTFFVVFYRAGATDVAGTTKNNLMFT